jgi:hypothetical protein
VNYRLLPPGIPAERDAVGDPGGDRYCDGGEDDVGSDVVLVEKDAVNYFVRRNHDRRDEQPRADVAPEMVAHRADSDTWERLAQAWRLLRTAPRHLGRDVVELVEAPRLLTQYGGAGLEQNVVASGASVEGGVDQLAQGCDVVLDVLAFLRRVEHLAQSCTDACAAKPGWLA